MTARLSSWGQPQKLFSPAALALLLFLALPFERIPSYAVAGITLRASLIIGGLLIVSSAHRYGKALFEITRVTKFFIVFLFCSLLSALSSLTLQRGLTVVVFYVFVFLVAQSLSFVVAREDKIERLRKGLVAGALLVCGFALYQFFGDLLGLAISTTGLREGYTKAVLGFPRVQAASLEPLFFANFLLLPLSITLAAGFLKKRWYVCSALFTVFVFLTVSRGASVAAVAIGLGISIYAVTIKRWRNIPLIISSLAVGAVLSYVMLTYVAPRITTKKQPSGGPTVTYQQHATDFAEINHPQSERSETRVIAWQLFLKHPLLGVGPGEFGAAAFRNHQVGSNNQTANNLPLEILAETGVLGGIIFIVFVLFLAFQGIKAIYDSNSLQMRLLGVGALAFLVGASIQYQTISTLYIMQVWVGIGLLLGVIQHTAANENFTHS